MGKGKGRGSAKAIYAWDIEQQVRNAVVEKQQQQQRRSTTTTTTTSSNTKQQQRPRLTTGLGQLRNLIKERRQYENYEWIQQRRRAGFLPPQQQKPTTTTTTTNKGIVPSRPLGSLLQLKQQQQQQQDLNLSSSSSSSSSSSQPLLLSLQTLCLHVLGQYFINYLEAMGVDEFHTILSLLPSESLSKLSIIVSKNFGINNQLALCLGKHCHVEELCLCSTKHNNNNNNNKNNNRKSNNNNEDDDDMVDDDTLYFTDEGLLNLIPERNTKNTTNDTTISTIVETVSSWEDLLDDNDITTTTKTTLKTIDNNYTTTSPSPLLILFRLKRLELIDCTLLTTNGILLFLEQCPFITHLSLAGCLNNNNYYYQQQQQQQQQQQEEEKGSGSGSGDGMIDDHPIQPVVLIQSLPNLLPALQVLDVTRCYWINSILVKELRKEYSNRGQHPPVVHYQQDDSFLHDNDVLW